MPHRVSPFGYLRIEAYLQLPEAFRSLSRPSSAPDAKAFPLRSFMLDLPLRLLPQLSNNKRDGPILVLFRFELCRLICFTNKIVITHFVEASFVSLVPPHGLAPCAGSALTPLLLLSILNPLSLGFKIVRLKCFPYCCLLIICIKCYNVQFSRCILSFRSLKLSNHQSVI